MLTTTVGLALRLLERATLGLSQLVAGVAWSIASFFVVPALVVERPRDGSLLRLPRARKPGFACRRVIRWTVMNRTNQNRTRSAL